MSGLKKALLPYGTTSSAPSIVLPDTALFLSERGSLTKNYFENAVEQLNREYDAIRNLAELNELAYSASYNFVPRVGQIYHLYKKTVTAHRSSADDHGRLRRFQEHHKQILMGSDILPNTICSVLQRHYKFVRCPIFNHA